MTQGMLILSMNISRDDLGLMSNSNVAHKLRSTKMDFEFHLLFGSVTQQSTFYLGLVSEMCAHKVPILSKALIL